MENGIKVAKNRTVRPNENYNPHFNSEMYDKSVMFAFMVLSTNPPIRFDIHATCSTHKQPIKIALDTILLKKYFILWKITLNAVYSN